MSNPTLPLVAGDWRGSLYPVQQRSLELAENSLASGRSRAWVDTAAIQRLLGLLDAYDVFAHFMLEEADGQQALPDRPEPTQSPELAKQPQHRGGRNPAPRSQEKL